MSGSMGEIGAGPTCFTRKYVLCLFAAMIAGCIGMSAAILLSGRNLVWNGDELYQFVNYLAYYGREMREAFASLFAGSGFDFPAYTLNMGYGVDANLLVGSTRGDVFNILSIVCPERYVEYLYVAQIYIRMIAAAFAFSFYCFQRGNSRNASFVASLCYAFSGFMVFMAALRHPAFLTAAVYLPLIFAGADRIFSGGRPWIFIVSLVLQVFASTYYTYMTCIALLAYCLIKYFFDRQERSIRDFVTLVSKFVLCIASAFCVSAVTLLPRVIGLASQGRLGLHRYIPILYEPSVYFSYPTDFIGGTLRTTGMYFGITGVLLIAVFVVSFRQFDRKGYRVWMIALALMVLCVTVPFFGRLFNGMTYATPRWMYIFSFCLSYVVCLAVPVLRKMRRCDWVRVAVILAVYAAVYLVCAYIARGISPRNALMLALLAAVCVLVGFSSRKFSRNTITGILSVCTLASLTVVCCFYCLPDGSGYADKLMKRGSVARTIYSKSYASTMDDVADDAVYRFSTTRTYGPMRNAGLNHRAAAVDFYHSSYSQVVDSFRTELGFVGDFFNFRFFGANGRLAPEAFTGTKYYISDEKDSWRVPYGYERINEGQEDAYGIWESDLALPLVFTMQDAIPKTAYDNLSMTQRQEALLQGVVLKDDFAADYDQADLALSSKEISPKIEVGEGMVFEDGSITVLEKDAKMTLSFEGMPNCETYLQLTDLDFYNLLPSERARIMGKDDSGKFWDDVLSGNSIEYSISVSSNGAGREYSFGTNRHPQYGGKKDWLFNTGYSDEAKTTVKVTFKDVGVYTYSGILIVCQPVEPVTRDLEALAKYGSDDVSFDGETLKATVKTEGEDSLAVVTVPYANGWSALVDGEQVPIMQADTAFMAIPMKTSGVHSLVLRYANPGIVIGNLVSFCSLVTLIVVAMVLRWRKRKA